MDAMINGAEVAIGYLFVDEFILWEALQAPGSAVRQAGGRSIPDGNNRLALIGDAVLQMITIQDNYDRGATKGSCLFDLCSFS
jgi:hypothetical protein